MVNNYNRALRLTRKSPISLMFSEPLLQSHETESCAKKVSSDHHLSRSYILDAVMGDSEQAMHDL
jgi:hypothetical protein